MLPSNGSGSTGSCAGWHGQHGDKREEARKGAKRMKQKGKNLPQSERIIHGCSGSLESGYTWLFADESHVPMRQVLLWSWMRPWRCAPRAGPGDVGGHGAARMSLGAWLQAATDTRVGAEPTAGHRAAKPALPPGSDTLTHTCTGCSLQGNALTSYSY